MKPRKYGELAEKVGVAVAALLDDCTEEMQSRIIDKVAKKLPKEDYGTLSSLVRKYLATQQEPRKVAAHLLVRTAFRRVGGRKYWRIVE